MPDDRNLFCINSRFRFNDVVKDPRETPCPSANSAPFTRIRFGLIVAVEERMNAIRKIVLIIVWINVSTISGSNSIASLYESFDLPTFVVDTSSSFSRSIILNSDFRLSSHPSRINSNLWVSMDGLITIKIEAHKTGDLFFCLVRKVDKKVNRQLKLIINRN